jgi:hypothetical protein
MYFAYDAVSVLKAASISLVSNVEYSISDLNIENTSSVSHLPFVKNMGKNGYFSITSLRSAPSAEKQSLRDSQKRQVAMNQWLINQ